MPGCIFRRYLLALFLLLLSGVPVASASPIAVWQQAVGMAAAGDVRSARVHLTGALSMMPDSPDDLWRERMQIAVILLDMRQHQALFATALAQQPVAGWMQTQLILRYLHDHPAVEQSSPVLPGLLAALLPGAGHAWQGRWRDAGVAAVLVIPMLLLTLWSARRRLGPVTLFFALITVWLWSGSVFSAISLAERGTAEAYMLWWQGLWQAAALPGRPW